MTAPPATCCPIVELRRYRLHPGTRETMIAIFDREFVETQEATGMEVIAQFRDIDEPDVFTWLRGFPDMPSRAQSLGAFYDGPAWARHRDAANATMVDFDNVRLLRPLHPASGFALGPRAAAGATAIPPGLVAITIYTLEQIAAPSFGSFYGARIAPRIMTAGARPLAVLETEPSPNTFPRLPVREGERAFIWVAAFDDVEAHSRFLTTLARDREWTDLVRPALERRLAEPPDVWRLTPTARSRRLSP
jgi:hypothetical protein